MARTPRLIFRLVPIHSGNSRPERNTSSASSILLPRTCGRCTLTTTLSPSSVCNPSIRLIFNLDTNIRIQLRTSSPSSHTPLTGLISVLVNATTLLLRPTRLSAPTSSALSRKENAQVPLTILVLVLPTASSNTKVPQATCQPRPPTWGQPHSPVSARMSLLHLLCHTSPRPEVIPASSPPSLLLSRLAHQTSSPRPMMVPSSAGT